MVKNFNPIGARSTGESTWKSHSMTKEIYFPSNRWMVLRTNPFAEIVPGAQARFNKKISEIFTSFICQLGKSLKA